MSAIARVSSGKLYQGGSSVIIMKGGHDQTKVSVVSILN